MRGAAISGYERLEFALSHKRMGHPLRDADLRPAKAECGGFTDLVAIYFSSTMARANPVLVVWKNLFAGPPRSYAGARVTVYSGGTGADRGESGSGARAIANAALPASATTEISRFIDVSFM